MTSRIPPLRLLAFAWIASASVQAGSRYFGLEPPRGAPELFEPALLEFARQPNLSIASPAFSPDFRRFVFTVEDKSDPARVSVSVYETRRMSDDPKGGWSPPAPVAALTEGGYTAGEGAFSADGRWLYYSSSRPPGAPGLMPRIFRAAVTAQGLGTPVYVPIEPTHGGGTFYPRPVTEGLAFTAPGPVGRDDLFVASPRADGYDRAQPLGDDFNSPQDDWDLVETTDGRLRIWVSARPGGAGRTDLWFSRREAGGTWSKSRNLAAVNSAALETAPQLTPDNRVLFFLRRADGVNRLYWVDLASVLELAP